MLTIWLTNHAPDLNLISALAVFLGGVLIVWLLKPAVFDKHPFCRDVFICWLAQWFFLIVVWAGYKNSHSLQSPGLFLVLAMIDLFSMANLAFYWAYSEAERITWGHTLRVLTAVYTGLLIWNLVVGSEILNSPIGRPSDNVTRAILFWRSFWILPSEITSALSLLLIGWVFVRRYGFGVLPFSAVVIPAYVILSRTTYYGIFIHPNSQVWALGLGLSKLVYGLFFYTIFFLPARTYEPLDSVHFVIDKSREKNALHWTLANASTLTFAVLSALLTNAVEWWVSHQ